MIRYDGNTFERFDSTTGIANVRSLFVDSRDRLWIGTNDSGVFLMTRGELQKWDKSEGMLSSSVRAIVEDMNGKTYIGSTAGIAIMDADLNLAILDDDRISAQTIKQMRLGSDGMVYGLTQNGDVFTLENGVVRNFLSSDDAPIEGIMSILLDDDNPGYLYLGAESSQIMYGRLGKYFYAENSSECRAALRRRRHGVYRRQDLDLRRKRNRKRRR